MAVAKGKRNITIAVVLLVLLGVGTATYLTSAPSAGEEQGTAKLKNVGENEVSVVPGTSNDAEFNALQEKVNEQRYEEAKNSGKAFIPTIINDQIEEEVVPEPEPTPEPEPIPEPAVEPEPEVIPEFKPEPIPEPVIEPVKPRIIKYQIQQPEEKQGESALEAMYLQEIELIRNSIYNQQAPVVIAQISERNYAGQEDVGRQARLAERAEKREQTATSTTSSEKTKQSNSATFVRAGTIVPAEMVTSLSTDEPGPVLAQIVSGPLKGARVIGSVTNAPTSVTDNVQKVTIQFTRIEKDGWRTGYSINAYAIDMATSRNAVASSVNNHYFRRYGLGTVAALVEGLGESFSNTNKTVTYTDQATIVQVANDTKNNFKSAMGNVGKKLGREIDKISDVPATIYVNAGESIGLLFMSDF